MKVGRGRDGHRDEFGDVLETMGWWIRTGGASYSRLSDAPRLFVNRWFWRYAPEGRRWAVRSEPKPYQERVAYARLQLADVRDVPLVDLTGREDLEPEVIGCWTRWGAERLCAQLAPVSRGSFFEDPKVVRL